MICSDGLAIRRTDESRLQREKSCIERTILMMKKLVDIEVSIDDFAQADHGYMKCINPDHEVFQSRIDYEYADLQNRTWIIDHWTREQVDNLLGVKLIERRDTGYHLEYFPPHLFYCFWRGVNCKHDVVKEILWRRPAVLIRCIDLDWLPPTATTVHMDKQGTNKMFHTEMLPRRLTVLHLTRCDLTGAPDFGKLPERLRDLNLQQNRFTGTIWLTNLPKSLSSIDVSGNEIDLLVVSNASLPKKLKKVFFAQPGGEADVRTIDGETNLQLFQVVSGRAKKKGKHPKVY